MFFLTADGDTERILLITAHHVLFTSERRSRNKHFECKKDNRHNAMIFSGASFANFHESIRAEIKGKRQFSSRPMRAEY
jgi:hypothetical protein